MSQPFTSTGLDALPPAEMARKAESVAVAKAGMDTSARSCCRSRGCLRRAGGDLRRDGRSGAGDLPYGVVRLLAGLAFTLGLGLVLVVAGAELFTGDNLIVMAWASRRVSTAALLSNVARLGREPRRGASAALAGTTGSPARSTRAGPRRPDLGRLPPRQPAPGDRWQRVVDGLMVGVVNWLVSLRPKGEVA